MEHALWWRQHRKKREREMAVIFSVDQSAFTQYHQDKEERRREEETVEEIRRGDTSTRVGN